AAGFEDEVVRRVGRGRHDEVETLGSGANPLELTLEHRPANDGTEHLAGKARGFRPSLHDDEDIHHATRALSCRGAETPKRFRHTRAMLAAAVRFCRGRSLFRCSSGNSEWTSLPRTSPVRDVDENSVTSTSQLATMCSVFPVS